jgi:hypothetical protein
MIPIIKLSKFRNLMLTRSTNVADVSCYGKRCGTTKGEYPKIHRIID